MFKRKIIHFATCFYIVVFLFCTGGFLSAQIETPKPMDTPASSSADPGGAVPASDSVASSSVPAGAEPRASMPAQISRTPSPFTSPTIAAQSSPTPTTPILVTGGTSSGLWGNNPFLAVVLGLIALAAALTAYKIYKSKSEDKSGQSERCGNIKELLEQKKKELEDMARSWPEEKIKEIAKDKVVGEINKNETAGKILAVAENLKEKFDKLKETVDMLQKRYDLCVLEVPSPGNAFKGTIIENSLKDKKILENLQIKKTHRLEDWLLHDVTVSEEQIGKLGQHLDDGPWYMHFWQEGKDDVTIVFRDKTFKIKYSDKSTWTKAVEYGKSIGIPEEQLDFSIK